MMSGRYLSLLERRTAVRLLLEREQQSRNPSLVRLIRLKRLDLILAAKLRDLAEKKLARMASAPRFRPVLSASAHR
jgi:hypothetical protein